MKNILYILSLITLFCLSCSSRIDPGTERITDTIDQECDNIDSRLNRFQVITAEDPARSNSRNNITGYIQNSQISKITLEYYEETARSVYNYYFKDNSLIFVFEGIYNYNKPLSPDEPQEKIIQETAKAFTQKVENKYYFNNDTLIKVIDRNRRVADINSSEVKEQEKYLQAEAQRIKEALSRK